MPRSKAANDAAARPPRSVAAHEIAEAFAEGARIYVPGGASMPVKLLEALERSARPDLSFVATAFPGVNEFPAALAAASARVEMLFAMRAYAPSLASGRLVQMPLHLSEAGAWLTGSGRPDAMLVQVAPPDHHGRCSLGVGADLVPLLAGQVRTIVAEVNGRMPRVPDAPSLGWSQLSAVHETDRPLPEFPDATPDAEARAIARRAAALIEDGSCLQTGIGALPVALARALSARRDLSIHSGVLGDGLASLVECGAVTGRYSPAGRPPALGAYIAGSAATYALAAEGKLAVRPPTFTHDIGVIAAIDRFVSVNAALEVDLLGQVNAEAIDGRAVSGTSGFVDFVRGARRSSGGRSIVLLPSTGRAGTRSRIVAALAEGTPVTCTRSDIDTVVTEHGVAQLRHLSVDERAARLIEIAAPAFRAALAGQWQALRKRLYG